MRRDPQLVLALGDEARARHGVAAGDVPGDVAIQVLVVALLAAERVAAAAERLGAAQRDLVAHRPRFVVDRARECVDGDLRPWLTGQIGLAEGPPRAVAAV